MIRCSKNETYINVTHKVAPEATEVDFELSWDTQTLWPSRGWKRILDDFGTWLFFFWRSHWQRIVNPIIPYHRWISRLKRTLLSSFRTFIHVGVVRPSWPWAWGWRFRRGSHPNHWGDRTPIYFLCKLHRLLNIQLCRFAITALAKIVVLSSHNFLGALGTTTVWSRILESWSSWEGQLCLHQHLFKA